MKKNTISTKSALLFVSFVLIFTFVFSMVAMAGTIAPGFSDGDDETITDATVPLVDADIDDEDDETITDVTVPLVDADIDDGKPNPSTGDNMLLVILGGLSLAAVGSYIVVSRKKIQVK